MSQLIGFVVKGKENNVCKLNKAIYGLKESGRQWNTKLISILIELGLQQLSAD